MQTGLKFESDQRAGDHMGSCWQQQEDCQGICRLHGIIDNYLYLFISFPADCTEMK